MFPESECGYDQQNHPIPKPTKPYRRTSDLPVSQQLQNLYAERVQIMLTLRDANLHIGSKANSERRLEIVLREIDELGGVL